MEAPTKHSFTEKDPLRHLQWSERPDGSLNIKYGGIPISHLRRDELHELLRAVVVFEHEQEKLREARHQEIMASQRESHEHLRALSEQVSRLQERAKDLVPG